MSESSGPSPQGILAQEESRLTGDHTFIIRRIYEEAFNNGNVAILDEFLARNFVDHNPVPGQGQTREGYKATIAKLHESGQKWQFVIEQISQTRDLIVASMTAYPVPQDFEDETVSKVQAVRGAVMYRIVDGHITDRWGAMGPMQQLGVFAVTSSPSG